MVGIDIKVPLRYCEKDIKKAIEEKLGKEYSGCSTLLRRELDTSENKAKYKLRVGIVLDPYEEIRLCKKKYCQNLSFTYAFVSAS